LPVSFVTSWKVYCFKTARNRKIFVRKRLILLQDALTRASQLSDSWRLSCFETNLALVFFDFFRYFSQKLESVLFRDSPNPENSPMDATEAPRQEAADREPAQPLEDPKACQHQQDGCDCHGLIAQVVVLEGALALAAGVLHGDGLGGGLHREPAFLCLSVCNTESGADWFSHFIGRSSVKEIPRKFRKTQKIVTLIRLSVKRAD
jgi:hypothetical protein